MVLPLMTRRGYGEQTRLGTVWQGHSHLGESRRVRGEGVASAAKGTPVLKGSWRFHAIWQGGQGATDEDTALVAVETPVYWRCLDCGGEH